ncbi:unnamed protein product [Mesocestoides corti]|uniref:F-box domain-containing protein n=2 Tax=Mesocestoides corti TaxID=53468 RepID=A0A158QVB8_MESCO|nr:unnamed protein product [Mesocestoides corti]
MSFIPPAPLPPPLPVQKRVLLEDTFCYKHCRNCILLDCALNDCPVVKCPLRCGSQMHTCKVEEHVANVCPLFELPCVNSEIGCPRKMERRMRGQHLLSCPASIVHCTAEWNRMPRLLGEKRPFLLPPSCNCCNVSSQLLERTPFTQLAPNHSCLLRYHTEKFDIALTARDQAILEIGSKVSDKTKGALRSDLTKLYPALPMKSPLYDGVAKVTTDGSKIHMMSSPHTLIPATPSGLPLSDPFDQNDNLGFESESSDFENSFMLIESETDDVNNATDDESHALQSASMTPTTPVDIDASNGPETTISSPSPMRLSSSCPLTEKMSWAISDRSLQVDCQMEFFPRYVQKPPAMYTFLCDQDIPRRAYGHHTLLHSEALVQVDYWLEQRCPLAYLGCPFSVVRLRPNTQSAYLAYIPTVNVFTVRYTDEHNPQTVRRLNNSNSEDFSCSRLDQLPRELLQKIINMLDEVSLMSLSQVSPRLAEACKDVLPTRGIVAPIWRRISCQVTGLAGWRITNFIWTLPTCGERIHSWHLTSTPASIGAQMTRHLNSGCSYYEELRAQKPFCLYNPKEKLPFAT